MSSSEYIIPHIATAHGKEGKDVFSVIFLMPETGRPILCQHKVSSDNKQIFYEFKLHHEHGADYKGWTEPQGLERRKHGGFLGFKRKEICHFEIDFPEGQKLIDLHITLDDHKIFLHHGKIHYPKT